MEKITAIICVLNEEKTIRNVILSIQAFSIVNEIIIVNDGSTDNTGEIIKDLKQQIDIIDINLPKNRGKGYAMAIGVEYATNEIIVFVDADQVIIPSNYVKHKNKYEKTSLIKATKNYINEGLEIAYTATILNHDLLFKYHNYIFSKYYRKIKTKILSH